MRSEKSETFPLSCERCGWTDPLGPRTISFFDLKRICRTCRQEERRHPRYNQAVLAEAAAARQGDQHFTGIGLPEDLRRDHASALPTV